MLKFSFSYILLPKIWRQNLNLKKNCSFLQISLSIIIDTIDYTQPFSFFLFNTMTTTTAALLQQTATTRTKSSFVSSSSSSSFSKKKAFSLSFARRSNFKISSKRGVEILPASLLGDREDKSLWDELLEAEDTSSDDGGGEYQSDASAKVMTTTTTRTDDDKNDVSSEQPLWEMLADEEEEEEEENRSALKKKANNNFKAKKKLSSSSSAKTTTKALRAKSSSSSSSSSSSQKKREDDTDISAEDAAAELFRDTTRDALRISKSDFTVSSIIDKINRGKVDLRPSYQREYVWTVRTASKLIESLLLNIPVPTMFFHEVKSGKLEVVDGKQRLTSIWSFVQNEFPGGQAFKLSGLEVYHELNGKTFDELNETFQEIILDYPLNVHTISKTSQPDFVFEVFERLNMGATQLNEQELRNCIYQGAYTDLLEELTLNESFLFANRSKMPHLRMRDRELILRFFTMQRTTPSGFYLPAKSWLNEEMRENKDLLPKEATEMTELFEKTLKLSVDIFGDCAFRPAKYPEASKKGQKVIAEDVSGIFVREYFESGEISVALWDTITSSFAKMVRDENETKLALEIKDEIVAAWINLATSDKFRRNMVSQPKAVLARDEMFRDMLLSLGLLSPNDEDENDGEEESEGSTKGPR